MRSNPFRGGFCDPIRVRVQYNPRCGIPEPSTYASVFRSCFKSIAITLLFTFLVAGLVNNWKKISQAQSQSHTDFHPFRKHLGDVERSLYKKMERVEESDAIGDLVNRINELQHHIQTMHKQLLVVENKMKIVSSSPESKQIKVMDDSTLNLLREEIMLLNQDKTGRPDYALESSGGCILSIRDTIPYSLKQGSMSLLGISFPIRNHDPAAVIQKNNSPGECWAFEGDKGTLVIQLIEEIHVTHVTLEHIPVQISPNLRIDSAPREFDLWGLKQIEDDHPFLFGTFQYDPTGTSTQTFPVMFKGETRYKIVEFTVKSNQGHPNFTCIYRIRIHGQPKNISLI